MNYLNMMGHKMAGSGYTKILIEANLVTSGSLHTVMTGKSHAKSLWCLKVVSECFERLLFRAFVRQLPRDSLLLEQTDCQTLPDLIQECSIDTLQEALGDASLHTFLTAYMKFHKLVRNGDFGKIAQFWMSFLDHALLVFLLLWAIKTNNLLLSHKCMADMTDLFFSFGGHNYASFMTWFDIYLKNILVIIMIKVIAIYLTISCLWE